MLEEEGRTWAVLCCTVGRCFDGDDGFGCAVRSPDGEQQFQWIRSGLEHAPWVATRQSSEKLLAGSSSRGVMPLPSSGVSLGKRDVRPRGVVMRCSH